MGWVSSLVGGFGGAVSAGLDMLEVGVEGGRATPNPVDHSRHIVLPWIAITSTSNNLSYQVDDDHISPAGQSLSDAPIPTVLGLLHGP